MGVDHGGLDIFVAEEFLDGADVIVVFEQVGGEGMAEGMAGDALVYTSRYGGCADGPLQAARIQVVATGDAGTWIYRKLIGWENVLPEPFAGRVGIFAVERIGEIDGAIALGQIFLVQAFNALQVLRNGSISESGTAYGSL